jgi:CRP-like cAMP-binding protein
MQYKANSIIFFKGDISDKIFILKNGQVSLNYTDIETGQEIHDLIKTGEFFGRRESFSVSGPPWDATLGKRPPRFSQIPLQ